MLWRPLFSEGTLCHCSFSSGYFVAVVCCSLIGRITQSCCGLHHRLVDSLPLSLLLWILGRCSSLSSLVSRWFVAFVGCCSLPWILGRHGYAGWVDTLPPLLLLGGCFATSALVRSIALSARWDTWTTSRVDKRWWHQRRFFFGGLGLPWSL